MNLGLGSLGLLVEIILIVVLGLPLIIGALLVVLVVANRADPDPSGRRPVAVYLFATSFVTLFVTLFASYLIATKLFGLIGHRIGGGDSRHPVGDAAARGSVIGVLIGLAFGIACYLHLRAAAAISSGEHAAQGPIGRIRASYVSAVAFVCVLLIVISAVAAVYEVFVMAAPGVFNPNALGARVPPLRHFFPDVYLGLAAAWILRAHLRATPPDLRPQFGRGLTAPAAPAEGPAEGSVDVTPEPPAGGPDLLDSSLTGRAPAPRPRRRASPMKRLD